MTRLRDTQISIVPIQGIPLRGAKASIPFADAIRLQESFTARAERKALAWLAARLPWWVDSDHLTLLGFVAMLLAGASYALARTNRAGLILATLFLGFGMDKYAKTEVGVAPAVEAVSAEQEA